MIRVRTAEPQAGYKLSVRFSDGSSGIVDLRPYVGKRPLEALTDEGIFRHVLVQHGAVEWPDAGVGIATEALYALAHGLPEPTTLEQVRSNENTKKKVRVHRWADVKKNQRSSGQGEPHKARFRASLAWALDEYAITLAKLASYVRGRTPPPLDRDEPLSTRARAMLEAGLASAKRGEIAPWVDFTKYVDRKARFEAAHAHVLENHAPTFEKLAEAESPAPDAADPVALSRYVWPKGSK